MAGKNPTLKASLNTECGMTFSCSHFGIFGWSFSSHHFLRCILHLTWLSL